MTATKSRVATLFVLYFQFLIHSGNNADIYVVCMTCQAVTKK